MEPDTVVSLTMQDIAVRGVVFLFWWNLLSLAVYFVVGKGIKPGLKLWSSRKPEPEPKDSDEAKVLRDKRLRKAAVYRYIVRVLAVVVGALGGFIPIWPDWIPLWGGILAGLSAGGMSTQVHSIVKAKLPGLADKLGGAAVHVIEGAGAGMADTDTFDALPEPGPNEP